MTRGKRSSVSSGGTAIFSNGLRKTEAARAIAKHVDPAANRSASFAVFHRTLMEAAPAES